LHACGARNDAVKDAGAKHLSTADIAQRAQQFTMIVFCLQ
jgi:hypothetical protein